MKLISEMTDEELESYIQSSSECGDAGGGYAAEAWKRYKSLRDRLPGPCGDRCFLVRHKSGEQYCGCRG